MFDSNCQLSLCTQHDPWWKDIALTVDVFHHETKHSAADLHCQEHCNPAAFPELQKEDGGWYFNSSIAEQTNVWLAGYNSMFREMNVDRYNFILDELIMRRNRRVKRNLDRDGLMPGYWSADLL